MAIFDDPNKELKRLEEQLLAEEYDGELEDLDTLLEDYEETDLDSCFEEEAQEDETFSRPLTHHVVGSDYDREMSRILLEEEEPAKPAKKKKGIVGLAVLCVLEALAIVGLLAWWYLCLR